jgi:hypothetical protein
MEQRNCNLQLAGKKQQPLRLHVQRDILTTPTVLTRVYQARLADLLGIMQAHAHVLCLDSPICDKNFQGRPLPQCWRASAVEWGNLCFPTAVQKPRT